MKRLGIIFFLLIFVVGCSNKTISYKIDKEEYTLIKTYIQDGLSLSLPRTFVLLDEESKNFKYEDSTELVYVDTKTNSEITFDYYEIGIDNATIPEYKNILVQTFNGSDSLITWINEEIVVIDSYNIARLEFIINDDGVEIYHNIAVMAFDNKVLDIKFRATEYVDEWTLMINDMFNTVEVE